VYRRRRLQRPVLFTGIFCGAGLLVCMAPSAVMHCVGSAAKIATVSILAGSLLGLSLALITRTRKPTLIYVLIMCGAATFWPLYSSWPVAGWDLFNFDGPIESIYHYLQMLRSVVYILAIPFPYAYFGQHAADVRKGSPDCEPNITAI
jgi:hypothetical protein